jgi:hypothetical protein
LPDNILGTIQERIRRAMNEVADHVDTGGCLASGNAADVAMEYAKQCGKIEGLAVAERCILDILEEIEEREKLDK